MPPTRSIQHGIIAESGIDYLTASCKTTSGQAELARIGRSLINEARADGNKYRGWRWLDYTGTAAGGASLGASGTSTILRLSGGGAPSIRREILRIADNVSRIDLQVTARLRYDTPRLASRHSAELRGFYRKRERNPRSSNLDGFGRGDTLTIGSRASNYYGRVYDKYRESKDEHYRRCWRYEIECKGDAARKAVDLVMNSQDMDSSIVSAVHQWYSRHGIEPRFVPEVTDWLDPVGRPETDGERQLRWLRATVTPVVKRLAEWYDRDDLIAWLFDEGELPEIRPIAELP